MERDEEASFVVCDDDSGARVDLVLRRHHPQLSRRVIRELFAERRVRVGHRAANKGDRVSAGERISVRLPPQDRAHPNPRLPLSVVFENEACVVVDKPFGVPCAVRRGDDEGTLSNALVARYPEMASFGNPREAGLVHRLDNDTSGLVLAAKTSAGFEELRAALRAGQIEKRYLAIVEDVAYEAGIVESDIAPDRRHRRRVGASDLDHRAAPWEPPGSPCAAGRRLSQYRVVRRQPGRVLLELRVATAYRHQIRAHLSAIGSPICGDVLYGSAVQHERHALHSSRLSYGGGAAVTAFDVSSELPLDLVALFDA